MDLPAGLVPGSYDIYASADLGDGLTSSASAILTVVEAGMHYLFLPMVIR